MRNLVRSRDGRIVHTSLCYASVHGGMPWRWAENQTREYVIQTMRALGIRPCRICKPMGPQPWNPNPNRPNRRSAS